MILLSPPFSPLSFTLPSLLPLSLTHPPSVSPPSWCPRPAKKFFSPSSPGCLTLAEKESLETRVQELKTSETKLKLENAQLKEVAEVARQQSVAMEMWQRSRDLEMSSLRHQLLDLQMQSDEKTVAGKLHHQIVTLEISEATALKKVEEANSKVCMSCFSSLQLYYLFGTQSSLLSDHWHSHCRSFQVMRLEASLLRCEHQRDELSSAVFHVRAESQGKIRHLRETIQV